MTHPNDKQTGTPRYGNFETFEELFAMAEQRPEYWKEGCEILRTELRQARAEVERLKDALLAIRDYDGPDRWGEYRIARDTLERIDSAMAEGGQE